MQENTQFEEAITGFKAFLKPTKRIVDVMKETGLSRPTVMRFYAGQLDELSLKNLKVLCDCFGMAILIQRFDIKDHSIMEHNEYHII